MKLILIGLSGLAAALTLFMGPSESRACGWCGQHHYSYGYSAPAGQTTYGNVPVQSFNTFSSVPAQSFSTFATVPMASFSTIQAIPVQTSFGAAAAPQQLFVLGGGSQANGANAQNAPAAQAGLQSDISGDQLVTLVERLLAVCEKIHGHKDPKVNDNNNGTDPNVVIPRPTDFGAPASGGAPARAPSVDPAPAPPAPPTPDGAPATTLSPRATMANIASARNDLRIIRERRDAMRAAMARQNGGVAGPRIANTQP